MSDPSVPQQNTNRELWRERAGDYYADSLFVTETGGIGMNVGGFVIVRPIREWHLMAKTVAAVGTLREHAAARPTPSDALREAAQMALGVFQNFNLPKGEPQKCADTARDALIAALGGTVRPAPSAAAIEAVEWIRLQRGASGGWLHPKLNRPDAVAAKVAEILAHNFGATEEAPHE